VLWFPSPPKNDLGDKGVAAAAADSRLVGGTPATDGVLLRVAGRAPYDSFVPPVGAVATTLDMLAEVKTGHYGVPAAAVVDSLLVGTPTTDGKLVPGSWGGDAHT